MRTIININKDWQFVKEPVSFDGVLSAKSIPVNVPHTWNGTDGQDGGNDYYRGVCYYIKKFKKPTLTKNQLLFIEFKGVNSSSTIYLNGKKLTSHDGGYSTFRTELTPYLDKDNTLVVEADNRKNNNVYPQTADFTFYGGIYRDVNLITVEKNHFDLSFYGSNALKIQPKVEGEDGKVTITAYPVGEGEVEVCIFDADGNKVVSGKNGDTLTVAKAHLWNGKKDPYLYSAKAILSVNGQPVDEVSSTFGLRTYYVDPEKGFFLNGKSYPLRGVCRHQDRPKIGNALTKKEHEEDIKLILEIGANTVRLAHYQHDDYFYDLCDKVGLVVWSEIPYISKQLPEGNANAVEQMKELIYQTFNHASIVCRCLSNEITMYPAGQQRTDCHEELNDLVHQLDPERFTVLACYMIVSIGNKLSRIPDCVSYNLYYGWYWPFITWTGRKLDKFHRRYPKNPIGLSEYGADAMPNLHSVKPKRGDNTEEYQFYYHHKILQMIEERPYIWATHLWNMFDFAADARNQGGDPGMNHKGMMTFDRKTRKDAFYAYKAYWSDEPFIHLNSKRFVNRTGKTITVTVATNQGKVALYNNGKLIEEKTGDKVFSFTIPMQEKNEIKVVSGTLSDSGKVVHVATPDKKYIIKKTKTKSWQVSGD